MDAVVPGWSSCLVAWLERGRALWIGVALLKVMPDHGCWPPWREDEVGNVDPGTLQISHTLRDRLLQWATRFDETLDRDDPASSRFSSPDLEAAFEREGRALATELQRELGEKATVRYWRDAR